MFEINIFLVYIFIAYFFIKKVNVVHFKTKI